MSGGIQDLFVSAYRVPTDKPESDGTLEWKATTMVLVKARAANREGLGYTYGHESIQQLIHSALQPVVKGRDPLDVMSIQAAMVHQMRNNGQTGLAMMAISAVDIALWDLKARLLGLPLCRLLGQERDGIEVYGSGGFTSYDDGELAAQLGGWAGKGIKAVKIKVGRDPGADAHRVEVARKAIGERCALYVDANGAYTPSQALGQANSFSNYGVDWLEEPVPATERWELAHLRQRLQGGMRVVAGEYGYRPTDFTDLLTAGAVDVLQADATRCGGITGFLKAGHLCEPFRTPLSSHCAPAVHLHAALSLPAFSIAEYFHDHVRIERQFFEGAGLPQNGKLYPDLAQPGLGLTFRENDAKPYQCA
jgi:L-alanine-DL-glutamate epimerase-like enolase superfamily enzyme